MIAKYRIRNYKCFADSGSLELGKVTVLLGRNNSGKSSLVQPLQMLAQTLQTADRKVQLATHEPRDFGRYFEWAHRGNTALDFAVDLTLDRVRLARQTLASRRERVSEWGMELELAFGVAGAEAPSGQAFLKRAGVHLWPVEKRGRPSKGAKRERRWDFEFTATGKVKTALFNGGAIEAPALQLTHCLPQNLKFKKPVELFVSDYGVLQDPCYFYSLDKPVREAVSIVVVAPVRPGIPRVFHGGDCDPRLDTLSTTAVLGSLFLLRSTDPDEWERFRSYLDHWLGDEAGFVDGVDLEVIEAKRELFSLVGKDKTTGAKVNLADTGFGIAQILPVLVQLYFAKPGQVVIIEEPELHLNPSAQRLIANLVMDEAAKGKQVVVETHSEHFLLRLRRLTVMEPGHRDTVRVYYVDRKPEQSVVQPLPITDDGRFDNWPPGFLDEAFIESQELLKELAKKEARGG